MSRHIRVGISDDSPGNVATVAASGRQDDGRFERVESIGVVTRADEDGLGKHLDGCAAPVVSNSSNAFWNRAALENTDPGLLSTLHSALPPWHFGDFQMTFKQH